MKDVYIMLTPAFMEVMVPSPWSTWKLLEKSSASRLFTWQEVMKPGKCALGRDELQGSCAYRGMG